MAKKTKKAKEPKLKNQIEGGDEHAEFSASGSYRWLNCPGSHELSKKYPPLPESKYAAEGTTAHACLEFLLKSGFPGGKNLSLAAKEAVKHWPSEMIEHGVDAAEYLFNRYRELPCSEFLCETKVDSSPFLCSGQFGTLDASIVQEFGTLVVADYKYGAGIAVDPRESDGRLNSQMAYYALALSYAYNHNFDSVEITVIQPRAWHESGETIRTATATMEELLSWHNIFREGLMETSNPKAALKSGKWCRFCPASIDCPELKDRSFKEAQIVFSDTNGIEEIPEPGSIALPSLGTILNACDRLEDWISKVRGYAIQQLERGAKVDGWKLVKKRGTRKWINPEQAAVDAKAAFGDAAFTEPKLKSPAQLEKLKGAKEWVEPLVTTVSSGTTLVPESDKRPAISGPEDVFDLISEEFIYD